MKEGDHQMGLQEGYEQDEEYEESKDQTSTHFFIKIKKKHLAKPNCV